MSRDYVPAAGFRKLTRHYDRLLGVSMREDTWRSPLLDRLADRITGESTVVDIGAGTGTLTIRIAGLVESPRVIAVDGDPEVMEIARRKPGASRIEWTLGKADDLPVESGVTTASVTSLVLHHLNDETKAAALREAHRILKPGGSHFIADWGRPDLIIRPGFLALRVFDGFENTAAHGRGEIPAMIELAGFESVEKFGRVNTVWGTVELLEARKA